MELMKMVQLAPDHWHVYKEMQLCMAKEDEQFHPGSFEQDNSIPDSMWQKRLTESANPLLFAQNQQNYLGMIGAKTINPLLARIVSLYVIPSERRKGIASKLLEIILETMRKKGLIIAQLMVHIKAEPAIKLYNRFGFEIVGKIECVSPLGTYTQFIMERFLTKQG